MKDSTESAATLKLTDASDEHIIRNLWPLYQHEVSQFHGEAPNAHGIFGAPDDVSTLTEHLRSMDPWWREPERLFPYLIQAGGKPAGFNLIADASRVGSSGSADFVCQEFFVLHAYRTRGVAAAAAKRGFDLHAGEWEVLTWPEHPRAISFWQRVLSEYIGDPCPGQSIEYDGEPKHRFCFNNSLRKRDTMHRTRKAHSRSFEKSPSVRDGDSVRVERIDEANPGWFFGSTEDGVTGFFPSLWFESSADGTSARARRAYNAAELTIGTDVEVEVVDEVSGWVLCRTADEEGWLPRSVFNLR